VIELIVKHSLEESTAASYSTGRKRYDTVCDAHGVPLEDRYPPSAPTLMMMVANMHLTPRRGARDEKGLSYKSIKAYLTHVKTATTQMGGSTEAFDDGRLRYLLRAVKKQAPISKKRKKLPITGALLRDMFAIMDTDDPATAALAAALSVGVHGLFRSGELTLKANGAAPPQRKDASFDLDADGAVCAVSIHLHASKTDPFRGGVDIRVVATGAHTCPVKALRRACDLAADKRPTAPLFQTKEGNALKYTRLVKDIKSLARRIGLDPAGFAAHSLRIGGATTLALAGVPAYEIQALGRWASLSYQLYTRVGPGLAGKAAGLFARAAAERGINYFGGMGLQHACKINLDNIAETAVAFFHSSHKR
jgi:hypothetical protein